MSNYTCDTCTFAVAEMLQDYQYSDGSGWATKPGFICKRYPDNKKKLSGDWCGEYLSANASLKDRQ